MLYALLDHIVRKLFYVSILGIIMILLGFNPYGTIVGMILVSSLWGFIDFYEEIVVEYEAS